MVLEAKQFLGDLPGFVLDLIIGYCGSSYIIVELWKCGNRHLNARLASNVTSVYLESDSRIFFPLPRMLLELRALRHFTLYGTKYRMKSVQQWRQFILQLPSTLESLHLQPSPSIYTFLDAAEHTSEATSATDSSEFQLQPRSIGSAFPQLRSLELPWMTQDQWNHLQASLPPHLTRLKVSQYINLDLCRLPKTIEVIDSLVDLSSSNSVIDDFPPNLHTISFVTCSTIHQMPQKSLQSSILQLSDSRLLDDHPDDVSSRLSLSLSFQTSLSVSANHPLHLKPHHWFHFYLGI